jgi:CheY-like chemotaxis protein
VLVVDDDPEIRLVLREVLTEEGYRVEEARDGGECLRHLAGARARLVVLLDLMMPGVDGFEVCHRLAKNPSSRNGHAIVLMSARRRLERADCSVADATLAKPFDLDALLSTVDQLSTRLAG